MKRLKFVLIFFLLYLTAIQSKEYKDTLWTTDKDRIIITYDVKYYDEEMSINFIDVKKKLGRYNEVKYKKLEEVEVIFFDRTGVYENTSFTNMIPEAFMVPANLSYAKSDYGFFCLNENPSISFKVISNKSSRIAIPIYLAHYEGKGKYELFSVCRKFAIDINVPIKGISSLNKEQVLTETVTSTMELENANEETTNILTSINTINTLLDLQTQLPFSDGLQYEITKLRLLQDQNDNAELFSKIKETLERCEFKKKELQERATSEERMRQEEAEKNALYLQKQEKARQDSIAAEQKKAADAEKKRNMWMVIGCVILAVGCFAGNQVLQHFRSIKNQKNMMEMQQNIVKQAENEAKRQARNYSRQKTGELANKTKQYGKQAPKGNKPKNVSI